MGGSDAPVKDFTPSCGSVEEVQKLYLCWSEYSVQIVATEQREISVLQEKA